MRKELIMALGLALVAAPAAAQEAPRKALEVTAHNLSTEIAEERAADATALRPGDVIEYTLLFTNVTATDVADVVLKDPVPEGMVLIPGTAVADREDVAADYSIDGAETWSAEPTVVVQQGGRSVRMSAPAERYTHVRWIIQGTVSPGAQVIARFHARVAGSVADVG